MCILYSQFDVFIVTQGCQLLGRWSALAAHEIEVTCTFSDFDYSMYSQNRVNDVLYFEINIVFKLLANIGHMQCIKIHYKS